MQVSVRLEGGIDEGESSLSTSANVVVQTDGSLRGQQEFTAADVEGRGVEAVPDTGA